ncbi:hypothetical protein ACRRTK_015266 [Alexandromys fortis]
MRKIRTSLGNEGGSGYFDSITDVRLGQCLHYQRILRTLSHPCNAWSKRKADHSPQRIVCYLIYYYREKRGERKVLKSPDNL